MLSIKPTVNGRVYPCADPSLPEYARRSRGKKKQSKRRPKSGKNGSSSTKNDHDRISTADIELVPLSSIKPSRINDELYRPVDPKDPDVRELAASIKKHGLREPLVLSLDNFILSGHRRYAACRIAGLTEARCRREAILSTDPNFVPLLVEFNRQRVKSLDEVLREEVVSANPEEAHKALLQHRYDAARVDIETGVIEGHKHRAKISKAKKPFLDAILAIIARLDEYLPLSDRQIHYQLLNDPPLIHASKPGSVYRNDKRSYKALTELLTRARIAGFISFNAIHDPTRPVTTWKVFRSPGPFIRRELDDFLKAYRRDYQAPQPLHVEILGEKNTIESIIRPVAGEYHIPLTLGRGYASLPPRHEMAQRFRRSGKEKLLVLAVSDCDPEGEDIPHSFARSMRSDFGIDAIEFVKVALTGEQVREFNLPPGLKAKEGSSRRKKYVEQHGEHVYELEAVQPEDLQNILRDAIENVIDMDLFRAEQAAEAQDAGYLAGVRKSVLKMLGKLKLDDQ